MKAIRPGAWTDADREIVRQCIRAGMSSRQVWEQHFPQRTAESLKRQMGFLRTEMGMPAATNFNRSKHAPGPPKPLLLAPLEYTLDECPRVTLDEAVTWMRQIRKHWKAPKDRKEAWRQINGARLFNPVPVPPFIPRDKGEVA